MFAQKIQMKKEDAPELNRIFCKEFLAHNLAGFLWASCSLPWGKSQIKTMLPILQTPHFISYKVISFWSWQYYEIGTNPRVPEMKALKSVWHLFLLKVDIVYQIIFITLPFSSSKGVWAQEQWFLSASVITKPGAEPQPETAGSWKHFRPITFRCTLLFHPSIQPTQALEWRLFPQTQSAD